MIADLMNSLAGYNRWANARLYELALALPDEDYRRNVGIFFGSLHATFNHLLATDRIWLRRLTGSGEAPDRLDAILHDDLRALATARIVEDARLIGYVAGLDPATLARPVVYQNMAGRSFEQPVAEILAHVFNHQTHHRGQAHAGCSILTRAEPTSLDMILYQRGAPAPDLAAALAARP